MTLSPLSIERGMLFCMDRRNFLKALGVTSAVVPGAPGHGTAGVLFRPGNGGWTVQFPQHPANTASDYIYTDDQLKVIG